MKSAREQFSRVAAAYATSANHAQGLDLQRLLEIVPLSPGVLLDVGTGAGHALAALAPRFAHAVGVDATAEMLHAARGVLAGKGTAATLLQADAARLPLRARSVAAAVSRLAAHHFPDPRAAFAEIARVSDSFHLVDNYCPDDAHLDGWIDRLERLRDPSHVRSYRLAEWTAMAQGAGFEVALDSTYRTRIVTEDWLARSATPEDRAREVRRMLADASDVERETFRIEADGFSTFKALFVATKA